MSIYVNKLKSRQNYKLLFTSVKYIIVNYTNAVQI